MQVETGGGQEHWERELGQWRASKKSMLSYSRDRGISYWQLRRWRKRLGAGKAQEVEKPAKVTLIRAGQVPVGEGGALVVRLRGEVRIEVARGFDPEVFKQVVRALEGEARC